MPNLCYRSLLPACYWTPPCHQKLTTTVRKIIYGSQTSLRTVHVENNIRISHYKIYPWSIILNFSLSLYVGAEGAKYGQHLNEKDRSRDRILIITKGPYDLNPQF